MMFVLTSTHARVCKERDEARASAEYWMQIAQDRRDHVRALQVELRNANAKLERFTGERQRDAKGHFVSSKVRS